MLVNEKTGREAAPMTAPGEIVAPMHSLGSSTVSRWLVSEDLVDTTRPFVPPCPLRLAAEPQNVVIDAARTALIVIDMQNDFCTPGGWLDHIGVDVTPARAPIRPLQGLLPVLRAAAVPVIWVNWGNRPDRLNLSPALLHVYKSAGVGVGLGDPLPTNGAQVLEKGSWAAAVVDELSPASGDVQVDKYRMSGFWDTPLDSILRTLGATTLLFGGVNADQCVLATLMDANFLGYDCLLLSDCTATTSPEFCLQATLYNVKQCFGFVTESAALVAALR
jgi:nicotinamidase-related amidase